MIDTYNVVKISLLELMYRNVRTPQVISAEPQTLKSAL